MRNADYIRRGGYAQNGYSNQQLVPRPYPEFADYSVDIGLPPDLAARASQVGSNAAMQGTNVIPISSGGVGAPTNGTPAPNTPIPMQPGAMPGSGASVFDGMRYANFSQINVLIGTTDVIVLPKATNKRVYLFIICTHAAQDLFVNFGNAANPTASVPIRHGDGFFEWLFVVPQQDIHLIANGANTTGVLLFGEMSPNITDESKQPQPITVVVSQPTAPPPSAALPAPITVPSNINPAELPRLPSGYYVNPWGYIVKVGGSGTGYSYASWAANPNRMNLLP